MKLLYLYSDSEFTPWRENISAATVASLILETPSHIQTYVTHFVGFTDEFAYFLKRFDLIFNVCYGFDLADQVAVAGWLDCHGIKHTASSFSTQRVAMDKSFLPDLCQLVSLNTPPLLTLPELSDFPDSVTFVAKHRKGSLHRDMLFFNRNEIPFQKLMDNEDYIVQPYIHGREFTVAVIPDASGQDSICLHPMEILPDDGRTMYVAGQNYGPTLKKFHPEINSQLYKKMTEGILTLHKALGIKGMSRTDVRVSGEEVFVLDINTMPNLDANRSYLPAILIHNGYTMKSLIERLVNFAGIWYEKNRDKEMA